MESGRDTTETQSSEAQKKEREYVKRVYITDTVRKTVRVNRSTEAANVNTSRYVSKQIPSEPLDINTADSMMLVNLPGIGPYYASRILSYRSRLGGYTSTAQLLEINGLPDSLMKWFFISDTVALDRISVNSWTLSELRRHPYVNFYQARAIVEYRRERGKIKGPEQLSFMDEFTDQDLIRLEPYLDFR